MVDKYEFLVSRCFSEDIDESYVKYSDYEALEAKLAALVEAAEAIQDGLDEYWITVSKPVVDNLKSAIAAAKGGHL